MNSVSIPLVSICVPAYNNAGFLKATIKTVLRQTYDNIELIIVDDCSLDNTYDIALECKENYEDEINPNKTIRVYRNEKNLGMSGNWNRCLELCRGKYIKLLCADDLLSKDALKKEVEILEKYQEANCVSSDTLFIDTNGRTKGKYARYHSSGLIDGRKAVRFSLFTRDYLGAPLANLFRKSVYEKIGGFDSNFVYILDYDFYARIYLEGSVFILHEPLNMFRIRRDSNTGKVMGGSKEKEYLAEHKRLLEKLKEQMRLKPWQINLSVFIRRVMSFLGKIYLLINMAK